MIHLFGRAGLVLLAGMALGSRIYTWRRRWGIPVSLPVPFANDALRIAGAAYLLGPA